MSDAEAPRAIIPASDLERLAEALARLALSWWKRQQADRSAGIPAAGSGGGR